MNKVVLSIAGSDSIGGAGIQADLKVMSAYGVYGMSVITAVTAQNTTGILGIEELSTNMIKTQLKAVLDDIRPDAVKIGMVYTEKNIEAIAQAIDQWKLKNVVLDPVFLSSSGHPLLKKDAVLGMQKELFPRVDLVTPNLPETKALSQIVTADLTKESTWMEQMAKAFFQNWGTAFLIKGGHSDGIPADYCYDGKQGYWFTGKRIHTRHTHGSGCTLSSAIACNLALGLDLIEAIAEAKNYLTGCMLHNPGLGHGCGPMNHCFKEEEKLKCSMEQEKDGSM